MQIGDDEWHSDETKKVLLGDIEHIRRCQPGLSSNGWKYAGTTREDHEKYRADMTSADHDKSEQSTSRIRTMAVVFSRQRPIGKIWPNKAGAIAAQIGNRRLGLFTSADLAIAAILDLAAPALTIEGYLEWFEALVEEEGE